MVLLFCICIYEGTLKRDQNEVQGQNEHRERVQVDEPSRGTSGYRGEVSEGRRNGAGVLSDTGYFTTVSQKETVLLNRKEQKSQIG